MDTTIQINNTDIADTEIAAGEQITAVLTITAFKSYPGGTSIATHDTSGATILIGFPDHRATDIGIDELDRDDQITVTDVEYAGQTGRRHKFESTSDTRIFRGDSQIEVAENQVNKNDGATVSSSDSEDNESTAEPTPAEEGTSADAGHEQSQTTLIDAVNNSEGSSENVAASASDDPASDADGEGEEDLPPAYTREDAIDDALSHPLAAVPAGAGIGMTSTYTTETLGEVAVHVYEVIVAPGTRVDTKQEKRRLTHTAMTYVRSSLDSTSGHSSPCLAYLEPFKFVSTKPLPVEEFSFEQFDDASGIEFDKEQTFTPSEPDDIPVLESLVEDAIKRQATAAGFRAPGIDNILSGSPLDLDIGYSNFQLFQRYNCSVDVTPDGRAYLHVNPRTRVHSDYTLDNLYPDIDPGLRVSTTYNGRGYIVRQVGPETVTDQVVNDQRSIPEYFEESPEHDLDDATLRRIRRNDRQVVWAVKQGSTTVGVSAHAPELLALQGHTENLKDYDGDHSL
jgi:hypothetical protein